jgi:hypothetical protein
LAEQAVSPGPFRNPKSPEEIAEAVKRLQEHAAPMRGRYSVDQFIAEKRAEAAREFAEDQEPIDK